MRLPIATYGRKDCFLAVGLLLAAAALFGLGARGLGQPLLFVPSGLLTALALFWTSFSSCGVKWTFMAEPPRAHFQTTRYG